MNKAHVNHLLSDYLEGSIPNAGAEKVKAHLSFCNACRQALVETERHINILKKTPMARVPAGLEARVLSSVHRELDRPFAPSVRSRFHWPEWLSPMRGLALAATCAAVFIVVRQAPRNYPQKRAVADKPTYLDRTDEKTANQIEVAAPTVAVEDQVSLGRDGAAPASEVQQSQGPARAEEPLSSDSSAPFEKKQLEADSNLAAGASVPESPAPAPIQAAKKGKAMADAPIEEKELLRNRSAQPESQRKAESALVGNHSGIATPLETVVSSQSDWQSLWDRHTANMSPRPDLPPVDFTTQQVVAIFAGSKPTGGHRIEISAVAETTWNGTPARVVHYRVVAPPEDVITTQVISYPFLFSIQPRVDGQTFFQKNGPTPE